MGIFDFLKGPQLTKSDANGIAQAIALRLFRNEITTEEFIRDADVILEKFIVFYRPNCSIEADQSRQILKLAHLLYENDKEYLDWRVRNPIPEPGEPGWKNIDVYKGKRNIKSYSYLTLFKDL